MTQSGRKIGRVFDIVRIRHEHVYKGAYSRGRYEMEVPDDARRGGFSLVEDVMEARCSECGMVSPEHTTWRTIAGSPKGAGSADSEEPRESRQELVVSAEPRSPTDSTVELQALGSMSFFWYWAYPGLLTFSCLVPRWCRSFCCRRGRDFNSRRRRQLPALRWHRGYSWLVGLAAARIAPEQALLGRVHHRRRRPFPRPT